MIAFAGAMRANHNMIKESAFSVKPRWDLADLNPA